MEPLYRQLCSRDRRAYRTLRPDTVWTRAKKFIEVAAQTQGRKELEEKRLRKVKTPAVSSAKATASDTCSEPGASVPNPVG
jgi:hypothetical protein